MPVITRQICSHNKISLGFFCSPASGMEPLEAMERAHSYLQQFLVAKAEYKQVQCPVSDRTCEWIPSSAPWVKANLDVSIKKAVPGCSLGVVVRDSAGMVLHWYRRFVPYIQNPEVGDAMAARLAAAAGCVGQWTCDFGRG